MQWCLEGCSVTSSSLQINQTSFSSIGSCKIIAFSAVGELAVLVNSAYLPTSAMDMMAVLPVPGLLSFVLCGNEVVRKS